VVEDLPEQTVESVMTPSPVSVRPEDDLADVVALMLDAGIRSVPVVDDGRLVGILSRRDVLRAVAHRELTSEDVWRRRAGLASHDRGEG
ncbi:MAG TPA: CBS domain-containing protein, partial [Pseudonocardia sp.]|nr:CBS domain-containing protein [Pseudonocardia sp.]